jgi:hypothetical protein
MRIRICSIGEYLPGHQLQRTESRHQERFRVYTRLVLLAFQRIHPMFLASPASSPFVPLPYFSKLCEGLPNGAPVCLLLCTVLCILRNADGCVANRRSYRRCGMPFAFRTSSQIQHHSYQNSVRILIFSQITTYLHMLHQRPLGVSTCSSFMMNLTLILSV